MGGQEVKCFEPCRTSINVRGFLPITPSSVLGLARTNMDVRNEMLKLIRSRRDGFSLQQPFYIDPISTSWTWN